MSEKRRNDEKMRKPIQGAIRIVTHGIAIEGQDCCLWFWKALDEANNLILSKSGMRGNGYGLTCNSAKFHGVIEALGWLAVNMPDEPVKVFCDVKFIVDLVNGKNKTRIPHLKLLCLTAQKFLSRTKATLEWKPRTSKRAALPKRRVYAEAERVSHDRI